MLLRAGNLVKKDRYHLKGYEFIRYDFLCSSRSNKASVGECWNWPSTSEIFKVGTVYLEISIDVGNSDERLKKNDEQLDAASEVHTSKTCDIRSVISRLSDISKSGNDP